MDACIAVERELDRVLSKFSGLQEHDRKTLDDIAQYVQNIRENWLMVVPSDQELSAPHKLILTQCLRKVRDTITRVGSEHRDLHSSVSKVGKAIDRNFVAEFHSVTTAGVFEGEDKSRQLNEVVCEHFLRQGMLDIAEQLNEEAQLNMSGDQKEPFLELHRILGALKQRDMQPALRWAQLNRNQLLAHGSSLEFKLHRLYFIDLIKQGPSRQREALMYARNFSLFTSHDKDLQALMGSLLYLRQGIQNSPYAYLLDPLYWDEICDVFTRDACALMGLSVESPLSVSIRAGCIALPPLLNIRQVMQARQCSNVWSAKDELPVEIDLGSEYRFHSIFACPILRQQSSENNPPVRLMCGHVISQDALTKLANGSKVKCPYCPVEQNPEEAKRICF
ncbi:E3 ubiquitin-protein ligase RMND5A-like [Liolophura sinensis]|uniref:E3 ubiquitin-protein ligase RMND5A-like n=1 Tax=Liolophura sinensis TaxID=3198878 RepID=UPI0031581113